ncbi:MAG: hypothetical protein AAF693_00100 [Bacteroidota bacterium]
MRNSIVITLALLVFCYSVKSQELNLKKKYSVSVKNTSLVSTDKQGNIYLAFQDGSIDKYDEKGQLLNHFSAQKLAVPTLIEAWNPLKVFSFYQDFQEYTFLDRFLTTANRFSISSISSYVGLVTISADNNLWLIDLSDFSLKKFDVNFQEVTIDRPLDLVLSPSDYEASFMREYQNLLFISDINQGILLFDNLGNYLRTISTKKTNYFSFDQDDIYFVEQDMIRLINIYSGDTRCIKLPISPKYAIIGNNALVVISDLEMIFFEKDN